jgi:hypothetical protein
MGRRRVLVAEIVIVAVVSFSLFAMFVPILPAQFSTPPSCPANTFCASISPIYQPTMRGYGSLTYIWFGYGAFSTGFMGEGQYHSPQ